MSTPPLSRTNCLSCWCPSRLSSSSNFFAMKWSDQEVGPLPSHRQLHDTHHVLHAARGTHYWEVMVFWLRFTPKIGRSTFWITVLTLLEVGLAKFTENAVSHLNLGIIELVSLVSYRFVSLSVVVFVLVVTTMSLPFLRYIGIIYALIVDTYYCVLPLLTQKL